METLNSLVEKKPKLNVGFFFLCLGLLITLITSVVSLLNLVFSTLDTQFPDILNATRYPDYNLESIRGALATLVIFFPIFVVVSFFWRKHIKNEMGHVDEIIKKWLVYFILFISSITIAIDLVVLVRYFISGEITSRFILKVMSTLLIAFLVGFYYIYLLRVKDEIKIKKLSIIFGSLGILIFIIAISYSFYTTGSPAKQKAVRFDEQRVADLQNIQEKIINYWKEKEKLPENLTLLSDPTSGFSLPLAPNFSSGEKYEYTIKDIKNWTFELCAEFSFPATMGVNDFWSHTAGKNCFSRTIDKDIYPFLKNDKTFE